MPAPKILLRSPNWVGDAVMATPVPAALARAWPGSRIHVWAKPWVAPLWEHHPDVERIVEFAPRGRRGIGSWLEAARLRRERYDLGLVLPDSFSSAWLMLWAGPRQRVGHAAQGRGFCLTRAVSRPAQPQPRPQTYLELVAAAGAQADPARNWAFTLIVTDEEKQRAAAKLGPARAGGKRVGLAPGSVAPSRRWPLARYAELADRITAAGHQVCLLGSRQDEAAARFVAERLRPPAQILAGQTSLREVMAVIRNLDLVVSNDSGAMHLAYGLGVPVVVLQGAADPRVTGPFGPNSRTVRALGVTCAPCVLNRCPKPSLECMDNITVEEAWNAMADWLTPGREPEHGR